MIGLPNSIISGGQSGADLGALYAAIQLGLLPGQTIRGWVPKGWRTEFGAKPWLGTRFGLVEAPVRDYAYRTKLNVASATHAIVFGRVDTPGSALTLQLCRRFSIPYWVNPSKETLQKVDWHRTLVAGNRETGSRGIEAWVTWRLLTAWGEQASVVHEKVVLIPAEEPYQPKNWSAEDQWSPLPMEAP